MTFHFLRSVRPAGARSTTDFIERNGCILTLVESQIPSLSFAVEFRVLLIFLGRILLGSKTASLQNGRITRVSGLPARDFR